MPKIKNYSKVTDTSWRHDEKDIDVMVRKDSGSGNMWNVLVDKYGNQQGIRGNPFRNKHVAKDQARKWMKNNPM